MKNILLFLFFLSISLASIFFYKNYTVASQITAFKTPISHKTPYSLDTPPSQSVQGRITAQSGTIFWQSRSATESSKLEHTIPILQGEEFWTDPKSTITILFPQSLEITLAENSHINFIQTLPTNFVVSQDSGEIVYKNPKNIPFGVRALHLLIQKNNGEMSIRFDDNGKIHITDIRGNLTIAFNDTDNMSTVVSLNEKDIYVFDDATRTGVLTSL